MKSLINWEELRKITRPPHFSKMSIEEQLELWNGEAEFYDRIINMELQGTLNSLNCLPINPDNSILDVGCGPGRITSQLAKIAQKVTALDSSVEMMKKCKEKICEYPNVETVLMDWHCAEPDVNVAKHDIVIASRSTAEQDIKKLCSFARKYVVIIGWANAPSIPEIRSKLFDSARKEGSSIPPIPFNRDRRLQYNVLYNLVYDLGYEPNINIVKDGFERFYPTKDEAYSDLIQLIASPEMLDQEIFKANVDRYLTFLPGKGFHFYIETRTFVMWWDVNPKQFYAT